MLLRQKEKERDAHYDGGLFVLTALSQIVKPCLRVTRRVSQVYIPAWSALFCSFFLFSSLGESAATAS